MESSFPLVAGEISVCVSKNGSTSPKSSISCRITWYLLHHIHIVKSESYFAFSDMFSSVVFVGYTPHESTQCNIAFTSRTNETPDVQGMEDVMPEIAVRQSVVETESMFS